mgnify:CR=1 FL=1
MQMVPAFHALTDNEPRFSEMQGDRLLIGLSGGKDSLSMLHSLVRHRPTTPMHGMDIQRYFMPICCILPSVDIAETFSN